MLRRALAGYILCTLHAKTINNIHTRMVNPGTIMIIAGFELSNPRQMHWHFNLMPVLKCTGIST